MVFVTEKNNFIGNGRHLNTNEILLRLGKHLLKMLYLSINERGWGIFHVSFLETIL